MCVLDENNENEGEASVLAQHIHGQVKQNTNRDNIRRTLKSITAIFQAIPDLLCPILIHS